jgi:vancomycin aglycone glucosyltransferase
MRVLLSTFGSRGDVQPLLGLAVALRSLGADARVCAPPDEEFAKLFAAAGVPLLPAFTSVREWVAEMLPKRATISLPKVAAQVMAAQYDAISAAAHGFGGKGCDVMVATGLFSSAAAARSVAEKLGMRYVLAAYCPIFLPSPSQRPFEYRSHPHPPGVTDNQVLWDKDVQVMNELFGEGLNTLRASIGLPKVDNVRDHVYTDRPWLAADPVLAPWPQPRPHGCGNGAEGRDPRAPRPHGCGNGAEGRDPRAKIDVLQTGAWILPDERLLPAELLAFLDAGAPPVYVGFGSLPAPKDFARMAIDVVRAQGRRVLISRGWAELALVDDREDCFIVGEVNQQALFPRVAAVVHHGGAGTTTAAARAGSPQVVVPQIVDQPYWASRVWDLGIGSAHHDPTPTAESLSAALESALSPGTRARALAVADTIHGDGAMRAAKLLLEAT